MKFKKVLSIKDIKKLEIQEFKRRGNSFSLMKSAGTAAAKIILKLIKKQPIIVVCGPGNNGGDGQVMARHLAGHNANVSVVLLGTPDKIKTDESNWNWSLLEKMPSVKLITGNSTNFDFKPDIIIDGILGTGIKGDIREPYASAINFINQTDCYKFAVDVPSGMDPQTGETASLFTKCDMTVTFHKMKQGIPKRKDLTGELFAEKIGIPPEAEIDVL